jgi:hypothetical protein
MKSSRSLFLVPITLFIIAGAGFYLVDDPKLSLISFYCAFVGLPLSVVIIQLFTGSTLSRSWRLDYPREEYPKWYWASTGIFAAATVWCAIVAAQEITALDQLAP